MEDAGAQLPAAPAYSGTISLSYARADDEKPPFEETVHGWVTFFWNQLRFELNNAGVHQATLWLDRYEIEPAEDFTERIETALREARLIVPILSPNWVQRAWCLQEITRFCELHARGVGANDNVALVVKKEPLADTIPDVLQNREGYRFFDKDPTGRVREFYWRGLQDKSAYFEVLKRIADWIYEQLTNEPAAQKTPVAVPNGRVLFVAAAADELRDARQRLVNDLGGGGYTILPEEDRLPDTAVEAERVVRDALGKAELAVHLLGEHDGVTPGGGSESILRLQLRLAREHAATAVFPRLLWAPKWLPDRPAERRDPFAVVDRFGGRQTGEEIHGEEITDLSQLLRRRLKGPEPSPEEVAGSRRVLIAGAAAVDDELVSTLANRLQGSGPQVHPVFFGEPLPAADSATAPTVLVPWGEADCVALETLLAGARAATNRITVLRLPGGDEVAKRRFFADDVYAEKLEALPADRKSGRNLLIRLEILDAAAEAEQ